MYPALLARSILLKGFGSLFWVWLFVAGWGGVTFTFPIEPDSFDQALWINVKAEGVLSSCVNRFCWCLWAWAWPV